LAINGPTARNRDGLCVVPIDQAFVYRMLIHKTAPGDIRGVMGSIGASEQNCRRGEVEGYMAAKDNGANKILSRRDEYRPASLAMAGIDRRLN
jgi:hypothetical protein